MIGTSLQLDERCLAQLHMVVSGLLGDVYTSQEYAVEMRKLGDLLAGTESASTPASDLLQQRTFTALKLLCASFTPPDEAAHIVRSSADVSELFDIEYERDTLLLDNDDDYPQREDQPSTWDLSAH